MKPGRARRKQHASDRARRRRGEGPVPALVREALDRFADAIVRWERLREPTTDRCPFCDELVVIRPEGDVSHYSHRDPPCPPWVPALQALGGFDMRRESL
jgi:hypothetical protein